MWRSSGLRLPVDPPPNGSSTKISKLKKTEKVWEEKPHKVSKDVTLRVNKVTNSQTYKWDKTHYNIQA